MVHTEEVDPRAGPVKARRAPRAAVLLAVCLALQGCTDDTVVVEDTVFGQVGQIQIEVQSPLGDRGRLDEILTWLSTGPWLVTERVSYEGNVGAETRTSSRLNPGELAREYLSLIRQLNQTPGLALFGGGVPQDLDPECATPEDLANPGRGSDPLPDTRVIVTIRDDERDQTARWVRCAEGTLLGSTNLISPAEAAPSGTGEGRVVTAAQLARSFSIGMTPPSTYKGTIPFASLAQDQDSPAAPEEPRAFVSATGAPPADFVDFWEAHAGPSAPLPRVDWESEVVLLAAVGLRTEAGDVVRVQRVDGLGPAQGTLVKLVERVPGDFCSPLALESYPYQVVVVPTNRLHPPYDFGDDVALERIPCDG